jgi:hypothetical protein
MSVAAAFPSCVRQAWLVLGANSVQLDNPASGYFCQSLDLGAPVVREVLTNKPDQDGEDDRTSYMAGRVVQANITAMQSMGARIDAVASLFAPFMQPNVRPVLHVVLDRAGAPERTLTLRGYSYDWPIVGAVQRDIVLQWHAADPILRDVNVQSVTSWSGSTGAGRVYPRVYPYTYPLGGGSQANGTLLSVGDVAVRPLLRVYGPITRAQLSWVASGQPNVVLNFLSGYQIATGHFVQIDCAARTAYLDGDPTQPVIGSIDWSVSQWPVLAAGVTWTMIMAGDPSGLVTSNLTQVQASWQDGYLW